MGWGKSCQKNVPFLLFVRRSLFLKTKSFCQCFRCISNYVSQTSLFRCPSRNEECLCLIWLFYSKISSVSFLCFQFRTHLKWCQYFKIHLANIKKCVCSKKKWGWRGQSFSLVTGKCSLVINNNNNDNNNSSFCGSKNSHYVKTEHYVENVMRVITWLEPLIE